MTKLEVFIEEKPHYAQSQLHVFDDKHYYTFGVNGEIIINKIPDCAVIPTDTPTWLLKGSSRFMHALAEAMIKYYESKGILSTDQFHKGEIKRFENEVGYLRELVSHQIKK